MAAVAGRLKRAADAVLKAHDIRDLADEAGDPLRRKGSLLDCVLPFRSGAVDDLDVNLLRGTLDLLILKALSWGPRHGYAVVEWIEQATDAGFLIGEGTLYPALHRLERRGWITAEWGVSDNNRQAKYYRLARTGRARLQAGSSAWHRFVEVAGRALSLTEPVPS